MYGGVVAYGDIVLHDGGAGGVGDVYAGTILHVATIAHCDGGDIASDNSTKPYGTFVTHCDISHNSGCLAKVASFSPAGRLVVYFLYNHIKSKK